MLEVCSLAKVPASMIDLFVSSSRHVVTGKFLRDQVSKIGILHFEVYNLCISYT